MTFSFWYSCRRHNADLDSVREFFNVLRDRNKPSLVQYYVSEQWLNKLEHFADPGKAASQTVFVSAPDWSPLCSSPFSEAPASLLTFEAMTVSTSA